MSYKEFLVDMRLVIVSRGNSWPDKALPSTIVDINRGADYNETLLYEIIIERYSHVV